MPNDKKGLAKLEAGLTAKHLMKLKWNSSDRMYVEVALPRFMMEESASLGCVLEHMGMSKLFTEGRADLSKMDGSRELFVSGVMHKAFIEVNEEGSEAAAATAVVMLGCGMLSRHVLEFRADHPFLFIIRCNRTNSLLFMGKTETPLVATGM